MSEGRDTAGRGADELAGRAHAYLQELVRFPDRHVGGPGNRAATELFATALAGFGFDVARTEFACIEWEYGDAVLEAGGERFEAHVGPYSLPCDLREELVLASRVEDLETDAARVGNALRQRGDVWLASTRFC